MPVVRPILAVIISGVAVTVANSVIVAALTPNGFVPLATSPGRNAVAIAALLPVIYAWTSGAAAAIIAIATLTVIPSVLAKLVFGIGAPWPFVLGVNAVYAVAAWALFLAIARREIRRPARGVR
jgi:hypothetical protein